MKGFTSGAVALPFVKQTLRGVMSMAKTRPFPLNALARSTPPKKVYRIVASGISFRKAL